MLLAVAAAAALLVSLVLLAGNWTVLQMDIIPNGDVAADQLLLTEAHHSLLLHGHYSRFNFYHPGPFFFDMRLLADLLFSGLFSNPYTTHVAATMMINGLFVGLTAAVVFVLADSSAAGLLAALGCVAAVLFQFNDPDAHLTSSWMPDILRTPYLAFLLALPLMARGSVFGLLAATFCGGVLVHGYVAMPAFVVPPWLLALTIALILRHRQKQPFSKGALAAAFGIILLFASPILLDVMIHRPSNLALILDYLHLSAAENRDLNTMDETIDGVLNHWRTLNPLLWALPVLALILDARRRRDIAAWGLPLFFFLISGLLFFLYLLTAPPPLLDYIGYFQDSLPLALVVWGVMRLARQAVAWRPAAAAAIALCLVALAFGGEHSPYRGFPYVRPITQAIVGHHPEGKVSLRMGDFQKWNLLVSVMADLDRFGIESCTPFLFPGTPLQSITYRRLCPEPSTGRQRYVLVAGPQCGSACLADSSLGAIAIDDEDPAVLYDAHYRFVFSSPQAHHILADGWSYTESWGVWSDGRRAEIRLYPGDLQWSRSTVKIDLAAFLAGSVESLDVPVTVNGHAVDSWHFDKTHNRDIRTLKVVHADTEPLVIGFSGLGQQTPAMAGIADDPRHVGLGIYSLTVLPTKYAP